MKTNEQNHLAIGFIVIIIAFSWFTLFGIGMLISSSSYRDDLSNQQGGTLCFLAAIITWTPTNIGFLCLISGMAGRLGNMLLYHKKELLTDISSLFFGVLTGLVIYFVFISGTFLTVDDPFSHPSSGQYTRTAAFISLITFICEYNPLIFEKILNHISSTISHNQG